MELKWNVRSGLFLAFLLLGFLWLLERQGMIPTSEGSIEVSPSNFGFKIVYGGSGGREVTVVNVPASRMATPAIDVEPGDTISISASGAIATGGEYEWIRRDDATHDLNPEWISRAEFSRELARRNFNHDNNPTWRDPAGKRRGHREDRVFSPIEKLHDAHKPYKLLPDEDYGCLLGCVVRRENKDDDLELIRKVHEAMATKSIFPIGVERILQFKEIDSRNDYKITRDEKKIIVHSGEGELVLLVNDIFVTEDTLKGIFEACEKNEDKLEPREKAERLLQYQWAQEIFKGKLAKEMDRDFPAFASELWYWDNRGSFNVTMERATK